MRKLLLGEDSDAEETGKDDFFLDDNREAESSSGEAGVTSKKSKTSGKKGGDDEEVDGEMTFTFVPGIKEDLELKKMQKRAASGLVGSNRFILPSFYRTLVSFLSFGP
jgi:hypothetical protein